MKSGWALGAAFVALVLVLFVFAVLATRMGSAERLSSAETLDGIDVPAIGTVGDFPDPAHRVVVNVTADGTIVVDGATLSLDELRAELRRRGERTPGEPLPGTPPKRLSDAPVLLRVDGDLPWGATQSLVQACAEAMIWKVFVAVRHETDGSDGAVALFLPLDWDVAAADDSIVKRVVRVLPGSGTISRDVLFSEIRRSPAWMTGKIAVTLRVEAGISTRAAVSLVDASMRAGARGVVSTVVPQVTWAQAIRAAEAGTAGASGFSVYLDGEAINGYGATPPMPAVARVRGALIGVTEPVISPYPECVDTPPATAGQPR